MKTFLIGLIVALAVVTLLFLLLHRVGSKPRHQATAPNSLYRAGLKESAALAAIPSSADQAETWLNRIRDCFGTFSVSNLERTVDTTYAETFYFRDAFHTLTDRQALKAYFLKSARLSPGVTFTYGDVVWNGPDAYLPWVMHLPSRPSQDSDQKSIGLTHLRYNAEGEVIFHQDYWDSADVLVPRVPVANGLIELVRRRF